MRWMLMVAALLFLGASVALAQESYSGDGAASYQWVHTNAGPGQCGCFGLNGGGVSGSWAVRGPWSVVADVSSGFTNNGAPAGHSLTLTSFMAGARYQLPRLPRTWARVQPFAQVMVGAAHAGGGVAGIGDASYGFASRVGGGLDVAVSRRFSVRVIQTDYYLTRIANAVNDHQNNFLVGAGIVYRWSLRK